MCAGLILSTETNIWLPSSVALEGLKARLYYIVGTFVGVFEGHAMIIKTYEYKPSWVQIPRHIGWHRTML